MNLANAVYTFAKEVIGAAPEDSPLLDFDLQANLYEKIRERKTIRIGDVQQSELSLLPDESIREWNAYLTVQCFVRPITQKMNDLNDAREMATAAILELGREIMTSSTLGGRVCTVRVVKKVDDWKDIGGGVKYAAGFLQLLINEKNDKRGN